MSTRRAWLITALSIALALGAGLYLGMQRRVSAPEPLVGAYRLLLDTRLPDASGTLKPIDQWHRKTLVINFWATWCPPCREEMPALSRLQTKHAGNGVQILGIAIDSATNVAQFSKITPATYPLLIADTTTLELTRAMGNSQQALPYTVVFSPDGKVQMARLGRFSEIELDALLKTLVAK